MTETKKSRRAALVKAKTKYKIAYALDMIKGTHYTAICDLLTKKDLETLKDLELSKNKGIRLC